MSPEEESFAGVNPERLAMLQARENPVPRDFPSRGRSRDRDRGRSWGRGRRGGGGGGRGGYQANGRRFAFNRGVGSPAAANGGTKESTPAEEQLSGAEMRLAFKRNQERRSGAVVENCANGVDEKERKRKWGDEDTATVGSSSGASKKMKNDVTNGVAAITNGAPTMDKRRRHKRKKRDKKAERAKKRAVKLEEEPTPAGRALSASEQLDDDQNLSREARKAAKKAKKEKKEKRKAAKTGELVNGDAGSSEDISKSRKPKKDKKSKTDRSKEPSYSPTDPAPAKKSKRSKTVSFSQSHILTLSVDDAQEISAGVGGARAESKWTTAAADLPGDDQRKSKFLRLLGAGAGAGALPATNGSASSPSTKTREKELERQYDAGLKMKAEKKRRGLGA
ncbi:unnamed protein product [Tuber aestivum]|uniref:Small acidic protein n=1 Tax=Tuber aestivum TaxID=59557 RepID=A0A292Q1Q6_9PEZI|nr:unnamed protein product [Tuber aestivum]